MDSGLVWVKFRVLVWTQVWFGLIQCIRVELIGLGGLIQGIRVGICPSGRVKFRVRVRDGVSDVLKGVIHRFGLG